MRYVVVNEDATRADIEAALIRLSAKARAACIPSTVDEIRRDQDELLEMLAAAE